MEGQGDLVDAGGVDGRDDAVEGDVAEERDLALQLVGDGLVGAADDDVGLDAVAADLGDRVLGGLGLLLARRGQVGDQGEVHVTDVVAADVVAELTDGFQEGEDLDVADGAAHLHDDDVDVVGGHLLDPLLDLVGDVGDDLDGLAQIGAPAFLGDDVAVDLPGGGVGAAGQVLVDEALVVAEVEVGLTTVVGDEDLAVLEGVHRPRVDVDVGVELDHGDPEAPALERRPREEAVSPLPSEEDTPPVTKTNLVTLGIRKARKTSLDDG